MITTVPDVGPAPVRRIAWGAIFAGLVVALAVAIVLNVLGLAIGLSTVHTTTDAGASPSGLGIGGGIWFLVSSLVSLFAGGFVAGRLAGMPLLADGVIHGIVVWSATTLATVYLLTTAVGGILGGATGLLGKAAGAAGGGIAAAAPGAVQAAGSQLQAKGVDAGSVQSKIQQILQETGKPALQPGALEAKAKHQGGLAKNAAGDAGKNPGAASSSTNDLVYRFLHDTEPQQKALDRDALVNVVAAQTGQSKVQASKTVDGYAQQAQALQQQASQLASETAQKAKEAADAAAAATAKAAFGAFVVLVLGALAAAGGGLVAARTVLREHAARFARASEAIRTTRA